MKLRYRFATQKVGSGVVAVTIEEDALKYNEILRMNSAGAFILEQLQKDVSYSELVERMIQKYEADNETIEKVLVNFLIMLSEKKLLLDDKGEVITELNMKENAQLF